jgi:enoyl-CoA hydratase/carnithine racemase
MGLVELWSRARDLGRTLASKPWNAAALAKQALSFSSQTDLKTGCAYETELFGRACANAWNGG